MGKTAPPNLRLILPALLLVVLLSSLDQTIVATALPVIARDLGAIEQLPWIVTSYLLTATVSLPIYGKLGDQFGRKLVLMSAIAFFVAGSALSGASGSILDLILFRALQGIGAGGLVVTAMAMAAETATPKDRARYQGWLGSVSAVSTVAGPLVGGAIAEHWSWRWVFYVNVPLGFLALLVVALVVPSRSVSSRSAVDVGGAALLTLALGAMVLTTSLGGRVVPWTSWLVVSLALTAIGATAALLVTERRVSEPVVPVSLLARRDIAIPSIVSLISGLPLFGAVTFAPLFWQAVRGLSPTEAGLAILPLVSGIFAGTIVSGQLASRYSRYRIFPISGSLLTAAGLVLIGFAGTETPAWQVTLGMALSGVGLGFTLQILVVMAQAAVEEGQFGVATSCVTMFRTLGGLIGLSGLGAVFAEVQASAGSQVALRLVFFISGAFAVVQLVAAILLRDPPVQPNGRQASRACS